VREEKKVKTLLFGNGDVQCLKEAREKVQLFGLDGVMLGIHFKLFDIFFKTIFKRE
jgi:tRNA-dihydrouridine synthase